MSDDLTRRTGTSWELWDRFSRVVATGSGTLSKRPRFRPDEPCYIARGKGCRIWDVDGNEYIDFRNGLGPVTLGYCVPEVNAAIAEQLDRGIVFSHPSPLEGEVAELLVEAIPCAEKVRYLKTGGEAMAAAIKAARAFTGRDHVVQCGYNGWLNSLASGGNVLPGVKQDAPPGVPGALSALHHALPWGDMAPYEELFSVRGDEVACVTVAMDYAHPEKGPEFMKGLRALTERHGALLITDEIVAGFRIALGGLHEWCGVKVDLAVFSKGMANGMPISAIVGLADAMDLFDKAVVSSTFSGDALALAAAKACMSIYRERGVVSHLRRMGERWVTGLNALFDQHDWPLRAVGMPACSTFVGKEGAPGKDTGTAIDALFRAAYQQGVSLYNVCYTNFSFAEADVDEALERVAEALQTARAHSPAP